MNRHVLLQMKGIEKDFSGIPVLHGVDFEAQSGEVMALMGENGAGKSTLMKILAGVHTDHAGTILLDNVEKRFRNPREAQENGIATIYQELHLVPGLSVAENVFLGREPCRPGGLVDFDAMNRDAERILSDLHFAASVRTPLHRLRVGHRQMVEIARALSLSAKIVVMDEPTSALSEAEVQVLFSVIRNLRERGVAVIYITHRMAEVFAIADRITVLRDGRQVGVVDAQSIDRQGLIRMMVGEESDRFFVKQGRPEEEVILRVEHLTRKNPDPDKPPLIDDISFAAKKGEFFGIAGLLGAGRTELLESLFGAAAADTSGRITIEGVGVHLPNPKAAIRAGIALLTEDRKGNGLVPGMSIQHNLTLAALPQMVHHGFLLSREKEKTLTEKSKKELRIHLEDPGHPVESLSGGNQQKLLLAKWLAIHPRILLLDDPTRGIDVGAKHEIYLLLSELAKRGLTLVLTSSELTELISLCDRIMVLREGKCSALFDRTEATPEKILDAAAPLA